MEVNIKIKTIAFVSLLLTNLILLGCGSSGGGNAADVSILFPTGAALTEGENVTLYGTSNKVSEVQVNGVTATSSDGFANWSIVMPLQLGMNNIQVTTNNSSVTTQATIKRVSRFLRRPIRMVHDTVRNRLLVLDELDIVSIDLSTGIRSLFSGNNFPDSNIPWSTPSSLEIDANANRLLVVNSSYSDLAVAGIISVDLDTGVRTQLFSGSLGYANSVIDSTTPNTAFMLDSVSDSIIRFNLVTGATTVISDVNIPAAPDNLNLFSTPVKMIHDIDSSRLLVLDASLSAVIAVDIGTGERTILSDYGTPDIQNPLQFPTDMDYDSVNDRLLIMNTRPSSIVAVDLLTGARTEISNDTVPDNQNLLNRASLIKVDAVNNRAIVTGGLQDNVIFVDLDSGERTIFSDAATPDGGLALEIPQRLAFDKKRNRVLVWDGNVNSDLIAVNLATGRRDFLNEPAPGVGSSVAFNDLIIDESQDNILAVNVAGREIVSINLADGTNATISSSSLPAPPNNANQFQGVSGLVLDSSQNRLLVTDSRLEAILSVDMLTGGRTIVSDNNTPDSLNPFNSPGPIVLESSRNRLLVANQSYDKILSINLETGARSIFSDRNVPNTNNHFTSIESMALDAPHNRLLVGDYTTKSILSVDLETGNRTILSNHNKPNSDNRFGVTSDLVIHADNNYAIVADPLLQAILAVHLETGERVIISR